MSDLQLELLNAGLVTQEQYGRQKLQDQRREAKDRQKMVKAAQGTLASLHSLRAVMDYIRKELKRDPTAAHVRALIRQAHQFADQFNLEEKRRNKMHAFLAKVAERLMSRLPEERNFFLDQVFRDIDPKLVTEE